MKICVYGLSHLGSVTSACLASLGHQVIGFDDNKTLGWGETGSKSALPIWKGFMNAGLIKFGEHDFKMPLGIINVLIDPKKGTLADENTQETFMESFVEGTEPGSQESYSLLEGRDQENSDILGDDEYYNNQ